MISLKCNYMFINSINQCSSIYNSLLLHTKSDNYATNCQTTIYLISSGAHYSCQPMTQYV
ncbi:hypothetical protein PPBDW_II0438 [Photobacterium kishitanii]|nr:hypothetical protein PPBDW_II0438 [Photobacterium kishitanii]